MRKNRCRGIASVSPLLKSTLYSLGRGLHGPKVNGTLARKTPAGEGPRHQFNTSVPPVPCAHVLISAADPVLRRWQISSLSFSFDFHFFLPCNCRHHESYKDRTGSRLLGRGADRRDFRPRCGKRARRAWCASRQVQRYCDRPQRHEYVGQETSPPGMCPAQPHLIIGMITFSSY